MGREGKKKGPFVYLRSSLLLIMGKIIMNYFPYIYYLFKVWYVERLLKLESKPMESKNTVYRLVSYNKCLES
jgi:hypothetical protein